MQFHLKAKTDTNMPQICTICVSLTYKISWIWSTHKVNSCVRETTEVKSAMWECAALQTEAYCTVERMYCLQTVTWRQWKHLILLAVLKQVKEWPQKRSACYMEPSLTAESDEMKYDILRFGARENWHLPPRSLKCGLGRHYNQCSVSFYINSWTQMLISAYPAGCNAVVNHAVTVLFTAHKDFCSPNSPLPVMSAPGVRKGTVP